MTNDTTLTAADLRQFTGTATWFCHWFKRNILSTEGVQFLAERGVTRNGTIMRDNETQTVGG